MPRPFSRLAATLLLSAIVTLPTHRAAAQLPIPSLSIVGGVSRYNLSGTGTAPFGAVRLDIPLLFVIAEGSLGVLRTNGDVASRTYVIPEVQLQWQLLPFLVKPYVGLGGGLFRTVTGTGTSTGTSTGTGSNASDITASASAGVRLGIPLIGAGLRAEVRVRGIGSSFSGSATEWTLGVSW